MQDFINAVILGVVEGFTEFLPVSSTGHLILANEFVRFERPAFTTMFDIVIQLGAILAVVGVFFDRLWPFGTKKDSLQKAKTWTLWRNAVIAFVPTGIGAFLLAKFMEEHLLNPWVVAAALIFYGVVFLFVEKVAPRPKVSEVENLSWKLALAIGAIQLLSLVPGTSRSGITIIGALLLGVGRVAATEFTFFLALPTMVSATGYSLFKFVKETPGGFTQNEIGALLIGFATAFVVAWVVIVGFLKFVQKNSFVGFGVYRIVLGSAVLVYFGLKLTGLA